MADGATLRAEGLASLDAQLAELPQDVGTKALRLAMMRAMRPVAASAQDRFRLIGKSGSAAESVGIRNVQTGRETLFETRVGIRRRNARAAALYNLYYKPKRARKGGYHAGLLEGGTKHMRARPALQPAWDANKHGVVRALRDELSRTITAAVKRLQRKGRR